MRYSFTVTPTQIIIFQNITNTQSLSYSTSQSPTYSISQNQSTGYNQINSNANIIEERNQSNITTIIVSIISTVAIIGTIIYITYMMQKKNIFKARTI